MTGTIRTSTLRAGELSMHLKVNGSPNAVALNFGTKGISFFPIPTAGNTFTLRLAGDGSGWVLVGIPDHWGESVGAIGSVPAQLPATLGSYRGPELNARRWLRHFRTRFGRWLFAELH